MHLSSGRTSSGHD